MDALRSTAPLARVLLALAEGERDGVLTVARESGRAARVGLAAGRVVMLAGVDVEPLAETFRQLVACPGEGGAAARVAQAVEMQLVRGLARLASERPVHVSFAPTPREGALAPRVSVDLTCVVWSVLLELAAALPSDALGVLAGSRALRLTSLGAQRVEALCRAVDGGQLAHVHALRAAPAVPSVTRACIARALTAAGSDEREPCVVRAVLRVLGAATPEEGHDAFALLLRKRRELARNVSASELLDLPESASAQHARRAFRQLAQKLHPDRFHGCDARLCAVSNEVMGALARAEHTLRSHAGR